MEVNDIVEHIFGKKFVDHNKQALPTDVATSMKATCLGNVDFLVNKAFKDSSQSVDKQVWSSDLREGRLGPKTVCFDIANHVGLFVVGSDRLSVNSQSNFSTIRANVCIFKGKWQYEVQLGSKGVMQVGWAAGDCKFSQEIGVGDTIHSYAYDGNRVRKWNVSTYKYGESWLSGDIIGCIVDLDSGTLEFYRNGRSLGKAFDSLQMGPGVAYFPSVSLAFTENLVANFGSTPLRYPVPGFEPLQEAPYQELSQADHVFQWLSKLLLLFDRKYYMVPLQQPDESMSNEALLMGLSRTMMGPLASLVLSPYIVESSLVPFLESLCSLRIQDGHSRNTMVSGKNLKLMLFLDMMWTFLEEHEMKKCLESVVCSLLAGFRHVSFVLDYPHQKQSLLLLTFLVQHPRTRQHLLENVLFDKVRFANFVHVKPLDEGGLANVVSVPWWDSPDTISNTNHMKSAYLGSCQRMKEAISAVEALQVELLKTLLDNSDGTATQPSSRKIFLRKFRTFLHENLISSRTLPLLQTPLPITLCCFHRLLVAFRVLWEREVAVFPVVVPTRTFLDGSVNYFGIDRLGGVLSHLHKTLRAELVTVLGPDHEVIAAIDMPPPPSHPTDFNSTTAFIAGPSVGMNARLSEGPANLMIPVLARMITQQQGTGPMLVERLAGLNSLRQESSEDWGGVIEAKDSLVELLDGLVLFYHVAAHKQIAKVSTLRESMTEYVTALENTKSRLASLQSISKQADMTVQLEQACGVFEAKLAEQARHMAWVRAAVYSSDKQSHLVWLLRVVLQTTKRSSSEGDLFSFVPDFYLDTLVEIVTGLRTHMHPTAPLDNIEGFDDLLIEVSEFLCDHFTDARIVHANSKDTMIQALASFVCSANTLQALEKVPYASRLNMVRALLRPYENRAWAQSNWVLVRFWQGNGFAFRYYKSPHLLHKLGPKLLHADSSLISQSIKPCPSVLFQNHVREIMVSNEPLATAFLNSLLNQLNWAFSEFIGMLQEIQNVSNRPERVFIESRQLKICATCFDLALALLRVLEMVVTLALEIFINPARPSSDLLLARLCQLLCQVLNRVSSQTGCFQHVVMLEIPDLETVDHFPILGAVVGILLALLQEEMDSFKDDNEKVPKVAKALLGEPSFQLESLSFVIGDIKKSSKKLNTKTFSFYNYGDDVSKEELHKVLRMIEVIDIYSKRLSDIKILTDEEVCTICYAFPISASFKPCNHESCRSCIAHHLMNSKSCFFCKSPIERVVSLDGTLLHDLTIREESEN